MIDYKTALDTTFENLENARKDKNNYLIENSEIEELLNYLKAIKTLTSTLLLSEDKHVHKLNDIQDICDDALRSEEAEEDMININIIEKITEVLNRDD
jgi:hypothetical protein